VFIDRKVTELVANGNPATNSISNGALGQSNTISQHKQSANDNSNSLWILENENTMRGGACYYSKLYRIKHAATGRYLGLRMLFPLGIRFVFFYS
jgi:hypothetical protein